MSKIEWTGEDKKVFYLLLIITVYVIIEVLENLS